MAPMMTAEKLKAAWVTLLSDLAANAELRKTGSGGPWWLSKDSDIVGDGYRVPSRTVEAMDRRRYLVNDYELIGSVRIRRISTAGRQALAGREG